MLRNNTILEHYIAAFKIRQSVPAFVLISVLTSIPVSRKATRWIQSRVVGMPRSLHCQCLLFMLCHKVMSWLALTLNLIQPEIIWEDNPNVGVV